MSKVYGSVRSGATAVAILVAMLFVVFIVGASSAVNAGPPPPSSNGGFVFLAHTNNTSCVGGQRIVSWYTRNPTFDRTMRVTGLLPYTMTYGPRREQWVTIAERQGTFVGTITRTIMVAVSGGSLPSGTVNMTASVYIPSACPI